jgi:phosphoglycolate phosphatase
MTGKISALIFDFDGTLIDSKKDVFESLMHAFSVCGVPINPPDAAIIMQKQLPDALQYAAPDLSREKRVSIIEAFKKHYDASEYPNTTLMPGARDLLETCARRSIPCSIVSNKRQFPMLRILNRFNLQYYFTAVYNPDAIDGKKFTKSQLLAYALKEQRLNRRTTAYIGDMEADILAARENGMISIAVTNGYGADAAKATSPDFVVKDLSEMLGIISSGQK